MIGRRRDGMGPRSKPAVALRVSSAQRRPDSGTGAWRGCTGTGMGTRLGVPHLSLYHSLSITVISRYHYHHYRYLFHLFRDTTNSETVKNRILRALAHRSSSCSRTAKDRPIEKRLESQQCEVTVSDILADISSLAAMVDDGLPCVAPQGSRFSNALRLRSGIDPKSRCGAGCWTIKRWTSPGQCEIVHRAWRARSPTPGSAERPPPEAPAHLQ